MVIVFIYQSECSFTWVINASWNREAQHGIQTFIKVPPPLPPPPSSSLILSYDFFFQPIQPTNNPTSFETIEMNELTSIYPSRPLTHSQLTFFFFYDEEAGFTCSGVVMLLLLLLKRMSV